MDLAQFLVLGDVLQWRELLSRDGFNGQDASLAYPVAGLYNLFLLEHLGSEAYLELYRRYNVPAEADGWRATVSAEDLPPEYAWQKFLENRRQFEGVRLELPPGAGEPVALGTGWTVWDCGAEWAFSLTDSLHISVRAGTGAGNHTIFGSPDSAGVGYLITADSDEIRLICLETGNLTANFACPLSVQEAVVPEKDGAFCFRLAKNLFEP